MAQSWIRVTEPELPRSLRDLLDPNVQLPPTAQLNVLRPRWSPFDLVLLLAWLGGAVVLADLAHLPARAPPLVAIVAVVLGIVAFLAIGRHLYRKLQRITHAARLEERGAWRFGLLVTDLWVVLRQREGVVSAFARADVASLRVGRPPRPQSTERSIEIRANGRLYVETLEAGFERMPFL